MALEQKPRGRQGPYTLRTALDFVEPSTPPALEMMMMSFGGGFIARRLTGQLDPDELPGFDQPFEGTIDGRPPQARCMPLRHPEHLLGTERATSLCKDAPNSPALASIPCHGTIIHGSRDAVQYLALRAV